MPPKFRLSKEQELEIVSRYQNGESIREIERDCPIGRTAIGNLLKRHNIETKGTGNSYFKSKYTLKKDYFSKIDSPEKAYWLGFISADGHVNARGDGITIALQSKDSNHLAKFLECIGSNAPIRYIEKENACRIDIYSVELVECLHALGFFHNKSKTQTYPEINSNLSRHFLRGILDGDGSISYTTRNGKRQYSVSLSGTFSIIEVAREIISKECDVSLPKIQRYGEHFSVIKWGGNKQVERILSWAYQDAENFLERKFEKYKEVIKSD